jgi:hypothetical protein
MTQLRVYMTEQFMHNNSVRMNMLQVGSEKREIEMQLDETANKKKLKQLCVKQRVCSA